MKDMFDTKNGLNMRSNYEKSYGAILCRYESCKDYSSAVTIPSDCGSRISPTIDIGRLDRSSVSVF
jgi:hypothetical protein